MNKLKMFETKQITLDLTKNSNPFFCPRAKTNLISGPWTSRQDHQLYCTHQKCHKLHTEHTNVDNRSSHIFLNVATMTASVALPLYMVMNYPLSPFAYSIKWVTGWFHWSQQSLIFCITCNILSSHKASHLTHLSEIWRKLHKNDS
jgi:hypothetical protein